MIQKDPKKYQFVDALRGIAVLGVILVALPGLLCLTKVDFVQVGQFFEDPKRKW